MAIRFFKIKFKIFLHVFKYFDSELDMKMDTKNHVLSISLTTILIADFVACIRSLAWLILCRNVYRFTVTFPLLHDFL